MCRVQIKEFCRYRPNLSRVRLRRHCLVFKILSIHELKEGCVEVGRYLPFKLYTANHAFLGYMCF